MPTAVPNPSGGAPQAPVPPPSGPRGRLRARLLIFLALLLFGGVGVIAVARPFTKSSALSTDKTKPTATTLVAVTTTQATRPSTTVPPTTVATTVPPTAPPTKPAPVPVQTAPAPPPAPEPPPPPPPPPPPAPAMPVGTCPSASAMERQFFDLLNATRAANGRGPLACSENLTSVARGWTKGMSDASNLHHADLNQVCAVVPNWTRCGENIGTGPSVDAINTMLINSPEHFNNIIGDYNQVGIGVFVGPGNIWVTFDFSNS